MSQPRPVEGSEIRSPTRSIILMPGIILGSASRVCMMTPSGIPAITPPAAPVTRFAGSARRLVVVSVVAIRGSVLPGIAAEATPVMTPGR
jgi:hypothetical protein